MIFPLCQLSLQRVALRKESVDRNTDPINLSDIPPKSLSARRAWIEMLEKLGTLLQMYVALRKESVDRNLSALPGKAVTTRSLSARRAWIEIMIHHAKKKSTRRRSPQGERG